MDDKKRKRAAGKTHGSSEPVLKKHVGLIHCENKLTLVQRKICNVLLFNALDRIREDDIHEITLRQLCSLVGYRSNDISLIKRALKSLITVIMEWNLLDDNKLVEDNKRSDERIAWYASSLLAGASIEKGLVRYSYSPQIKTVLSSLDIYGRINLFIQAKFNSTYSLVLYENCVRFKNIGRTTNFALPLFRSLMGLANSKYRSFKELNRNVIQVAINEINQKSDIVIIPEFKKAGRQVTAIQFKIAENENYKPAFKKLEKLSQPETDLPQQSTLKEMLTTDFHLADKQADTILKTYAAEYIQMKIQWVKKQKKVNNKAAYLNAALKYDYKENTQVQAEQPVAKAVETSFLQELREASQISSLRKKYMEYRFNVYTKFLAEQVTKVQQEIQKTFTGFLSKNAHLADIFKKNKFKSGFIMAEFIKFIDDQYPEVVGNILSFDDYISSEEDEVIA